MYLRNEHLQYIITWYVIELFYLCKVLALAGFLILHFGKAVLSLGASTEEYKWGTCNELASHPVEVEILKLFPADETPIKYL